MTSLVIIDNKYENCQLVKNLNFLFSRKIWMFQNYKRLETIIIRNEIFQTASSLFKDGAATCLLDWKRPKISNEHFNQKKFVSWYCNRFMILDYIVLRMPLIFTRVAWIWIRTFSAKKLTDPYGFRSVPRTRRIFENREIFFILFSELQKNCQFSLFRQISFVTK